jgi:hypothetical protein
VATAGLLAGVASLVAADPAAASSNASADGSLTFARYGDGAAVTCTAGFTASHNTDDPNHPYVQIYESFAFLTAFERECYDDAYITLTVTYTDADGRTQTTTSGSPPGTLRVGGAKSNVTVAMTTYYTDCNPNASATCENTVTAHPK